MLTLKSAGIEEKSISFVPSDDEEEVDVPQRSPTILASPAKDVHIVWHFMERSEIIEKDHFAAISQTALLVEKQL